MENGHNDQFVRNVQVELDALRSDIGKIEAEIQDLRRKRDWIRDKTIGLEAYLRAADVGPDGTSRATDATTTTTGSVIGDSPGVVEREGPDQRLGDLLFAILDPLNGKDMHYLDLKEEAAEQGWRFNNSEATNQIRVNRILNSDPRFVRPYHRGRYALAKHHPGVKRSVGERKS